ncbi:porin [Janthinobacterium sp. PC23-8]|uniref:porin n=1 Tax=Janthinobacterium sp. PC23-8 TaxID=2012679 RepID=UPI000B963087|nr:porin [Janthinobacterium sp. PC23-8]OYO30195.1 hypothetical protein CD932_02895 [Janthinobacterium sp. PC23-8]
MNSSNLNQALSGAARLRALPLALMLAVGAAQAQDAGSMFSYSGFGTVGALHSSSNEGDYVSTRFQPSGAGASHDWDIGADTKLGAQVNARFSDRWSATVQVVAMPRTNNTYGPRIEWANLQYAITPDLKVRVGRTALASFMVSDTRLVGYSNTWARPPVEVYSSAPMTNVDGVDVSYKHRFGNVTNTLSVFGGKTKIDSLTGSGQVLHGIKIDRLRGLSNAVEFGAWTARVGYVQSDVVVPYSPKLIVSSTFKSYNIGAVYDPGEWFVQVEFTRIDIPRLTGLVNTGYVHGGYRLGNFTPYAMFAPSTASNSALPNPANQSTTTAGVRWDALKNIAFKLQFDQVNLRKGTTGAFNNVSPALAGDKVKLVSVSADFVF